MNILQDIKARIRTIQNSIDKLGNKHGELEVKLLKQRLAIQNEAYDFNEWLMKMKRVQGEKPH